MVGQGEGVVGLWSRGDHKQIGKKRGRKLMTESRVDGAV